MWKFCNVNPKANLVGDCVVRAVSLATEQTWDGAYIAIVTVGYDMKDMPSSNAVWGSYLRQRGFRRYVIPNECPDCYTIEDFCEEHPKGIFVLATGTHAVTVIDGDYYDTWDSGKEIPIYYFKKER
jgi:hypothetical protein